MFNDLREFITFLNQNGEIVTVNRAVNSKYEAAAVQSKVLKEMDKAIHFTNIDGKGQKMLGNIYTSRRMLAYMFNVEPEKLVEKVLSYKNAKLEPVNMVTNAPCQEVVHTKFQDILDVVPIPWNYEKDANRYLTG